MEKGQFLSALSNRWISAEQLGLASRQVDSLFAYLQSSAVGARTMLVERDYVDADYLEDFASFYVNCFPPYARRCKRLHFFREDFTEQEVAAIVSGDDDGLGIDRLKSSYVGFVVARPLPEAVIGRTVLHRKPKSDDQREFYPVTRPYTPNLFGIELSVRSLAFEEQDTTVAACATVALWSAFHKTQELFYTPLPRPAAITRAANVVRSAVRALPSHGLDAVQMSEAIRSIGLEAEHYWVESNTPFASLVYAYVAAGIPVILSGYIEGTKGDGFHAVTVTGYSFSNGLTKYPERPSNLIRSLPGRRIDRLFVHDDNIGPFTELTILPFSELKDEFTPRDVKPPVILCSSAPPASDGSKPQARMPAFVPMSITVPGDTQMRVTWSNIHPWLYRLQYVLRRCRNLFAAEGLKVRKIEWEVRMMQLKDFRQRLREEHWSNAEARQLVTESLPRFLWLATMYHNEAPVVDLIADATDTARSCPMLRAIWYDDDIKKSLQTLLAHEAIEKTFRLTLRPRFYDFLKTGKADHLLERRAPVQ